MEVFVHRRAVTVFLWDFLNSPGIPNLVYANDAQKGKDYICLYCGEAVRIIDRRGGRFRPVMKQGCDLPHRIVTLSTEI